MSAGISAQQAVPSATAALQQGPLMVWMVTPATPAERARIVAQKQAATRVLPTTVQERTLGEFGKPSSEHGQTAGSYGTPSSNVGQNASDAGQTAGSYGTTPSGLGRPSSEHGQTAGSYGTTAGNFGQTAGSYGDSIASVNQPRPVGTQPVRVVSNAVRDELQSDLRGAFHELDVRFVNVIAEELQERLAAVAGSADYPDVVIGAVLPGWWDGSGLGLAMLGTLSFLDQADEIDTTTGRHFYPPLGQRAGRVVVLTHAPHPERARAFVVWLRDGSVCRSCGRPFDKTTEAPVSVAIGALGQVLQGDGLGESADPVAAKFSADLARRLALMPPSPGALDGLKYRMDVMDAKANDRLAVVSLRAIGSSEQAFGVVHAVVVLRRDANRRWKVLQISPNVAPRSAENASSALRRFANDVPPEKVVRVVGISQAAPPDGDNRSPQPDLWWDNAGNAGLLAIEWQTNLGGWTDPRLMLVSDSNPRLQTRVTATFARNPGEYRWRVWSVGTGGMVVLSPWKRLVINR
jgi:hypothetical protein